MLIDSLFLNIKLKFGYHKKVEAHLVIFVFCFDGNNSCSQPQGIQTAPVQAARQMLCIPDTFSSPWMELHMRQC